MASHERDGEIANPPDPDAFVNTLFGVSCISPAFCVAVGNDNQSTNTTNSLTLVETMRNGSWSISPSSNAPNVNNALGAVSCTRHTSSHGSVFCIAAGYTYGHNGSGLGNTFAESLNYPVGNGNPATASIPTPALGGGQVNKDFYGVSCTSSIFCMAVGHWGSPGQALAEKFNGSRFSTTTAHDRLSLGSTGSKTPNILYAVTCVSTTQCITGGDYTSLTTGSPTNETLLGDVVGALGNYANTEPHRNRAGGDE